MNSRAHIRLGMRSLAWLLAIALVPFAVACSYGDEGWTLRDETVSTSDEPGPYYDQDAFSQSGGRYAYDDGKAASHKTGVDVADHQEDIDWYAVADDGIDFAILRVGYRGTTEGGLFPDERFDVNYDAAREAGLECGAYFFSQATSVEEASEEASFVLGLLRGRELQYPVAFDYEAVPETRIANVSSETASQVVETFCSAIRAGGYVPMVYGNTFDLTRFDPQAIADCSVWCAEYDSGPSYEFRSDVWQYTNQGYVNGIDGLVDLNLDLAVIPGPVEDPR